MHTRRIWQQIEHIRNESRCLFHQKAEPHQFYATTLVFCFMFFLNKVLLLAVSQLSTKKFLTNLTTYNNKTRYYSNIFLSKVILLLKSYMSMQSPCKAEKKFSTKCKIDMETEANWKKWQLEHNDILKNVYVYF